MADYNPSDDRNTSAPSNSGITSDTLGGTESYDNSANNSASAQDFSSKQDTAPGYGSGGPSAGYNDNVDSNEGGEKKGFMSKVKEKLAPKGPGPTKMDEVSSFICLAGFDA